MEVRFLTAGDRAVSVEFGKTICLETNAKVRMLDENLKEDPIEGMIETVPTYCALINSLPSGSDPVWETGERTGEKTW